LIVMGVISLSVPAFASAGVVDNLLGQLGLNNAAQPAGDGGAASTDTSDDPSTRGGTPPNYNPPLHGSNPHGQGDDLTVDLPPNQAEPLPNQSNGPELIVVGRSRGEQQADGSYHGHVTIVSVAGIEPLPVDSTNGQSSVGPLDPVTQPALNALCTALMNTVCLGILNASSSTDGSGSQNSFSAASANLFGRGGVSAGALQSSGNISQTSSCQQADGSSNVANLSAGPAGAVLVGAPSGSSSSQACNNGTSSVNQNSTVLNLFGTAVPIPSAGCASGAPDSNNPSIPLIADSVCNADDTNGAQTSAPYGVRESLTVLLVSLIPGGLAKLTAAGPESAVVAPAATTTPPTTPGTTGSGGTPASGGGTPNNNNTNNNDNNPGGTPTANTATTGNGSLPFTGLDLLWIAMLGVGMIGAGMAVAAATPAQRRPRLQG
jgi:hypothetical protein